MSGTTDAASPRPAAHGAAGVVVIGAGQAGVETSLALRQHGYRHPVTIVGEEPHPPYQRPPLSKAFLTATGAHDGDELTLRAPAAFRAREITVIRGIRVTRIDRAMRTVELSDSTFLAYDRLVLATGARPAPLSFGAHLGGAVHYLRTLDDARTLRAAMVELSSRAAGGRVIVLGGGFVGTETAAAASKAGLQVTLAVRGTRPLGQSMSPPVVDTLVRVHRAHGVEVLTEAAPVSVQRTRGGVRVVVAGDRTRLAELVVAGVGAAPRLELARDAGLAVGDGIVVDAQLRTSDPRIFAVGDCALFPGDAVGSRSPSVRLGSVQNAADQGRHVGAVIAGQLDESAYKAVPWFWTEQYHLKVQIAGLTAGADDLVVRGDAASDSYSVFAFRQGALLAVESVNRPRDHLAARRLLAARTALSPHDAVDENVDLKARTAVTA